MAVSIEACRLADRLSKRKKTRMSVALPKWKIPPSTTPRRRAPLTGVASPPWLGPIEVWRTRILMPRPAEQMKRLRDQESSTTLHDDGFSP